MSFSIPHRNGGPSSTTTESHLEVQRPQPTSSPINDERGPEEDGQKDATALQVLAEASFVKPSPPPTVHESTTLLPFPFAKIISTTTGLTTLTIRTYARAFEWGIGLGKETTLRSLELTRAGIEIVLKASAKDVTNRRENSSELARADTENVLARSISALHWAFTSACFATSAGFNISELYLRGAETAALQGLSALNAILGDTESSRAVSAIITLSKEELTRPGAEDGLVPGYWDLIVGVVSFVILQRWGRRKTALEFRGNGGEETIWDLVINDKGFRADVVGTRRDGGEGITATKSLTVASAGQYENRDDGLVLGGGLDLHTPPNITLSTEDQTNLSDAEIRDRIVAQLPMGTRAVITTNTLTLKTVQVDIHGAETAHIEAPPGLTMVSEELGTDAADPEQPHQTIIFRTSLKRNSSAEIEPIEKLKLTGAEQDSYENGEYDDMGLIMNPPKRRKSFGSQDERSSIDYTSGSEAFPKLRVGQTGPVANQKKTRKPVWSVGPSSEKSSGIRSTTAQKDKDANKVAKANMIKKALQSLNPTQSSSHQSKQQSEALAAASRKETGLVPLSRVADSNQSTKRLYPMPDGIDQASVTSPDRSPSARREHSTSYFTMHEKRRESTVSQTDSFSIHSVESRPGSPTSYRTRARADSGLTKTKSHSELLTQPTGRAESDNASSVRHHSRSRSFVPSLYSMGTKHSNEAIILQPKTPIHR